MRAVTAAAASVLQTLCAVAALLGGPAAGVKWLSLGHLETLPPIAGSLDKWCSRSGGMENAQQRKVCVSHPYIMESLARGAKAALGECQHQFRNSRWNCSTAPTHRAAFSNLLTRGTRETAFVHAIAAAGVAHAVTKACSRGSLRQCGCDKTVANSMDDGFRWGGCTDNAAYGVLFSKAFTDAREGTTPRSQLNLHNNEAGRKAIEASMRMECKCHGVSGSCEHKTCWKALPAFTHIGVALKEKFDGAKQVVVRPRDGHIQPTALDRPSYQMAPVDPAFKAPTALDLVYSEESPNFCEVDRKAGSLGTSGRSCERATNGLEGCDLMCCGRGYTNKRRRVEERCDCKFYWCCEVRCKTCVRDVEEHHCL